LPDNESEKENNLKNDNKKNESNENNISQENQEKIVEIINNSPIRNVFL